MRLPYFFQQLLGFLLIIFSTFLIIVLSINYYSVHSSRNDLEDRLINYASTIIEDLPNHASTEQNQTILARQGVHFYVLDENNNLVFPQDQASQANFVNQGSDVRKFYQSNTLFISSEDFLGNENEIAYVIVPIEEGDQAEGYVIVTAPTSYLDSSVSTFRSGVFQSIVLAFIVASVISVFLAGLQVKRIRRIRLATREVANGNYQIEIEGSNRDEIDDLSNDFNTMITALRENENALQQQEEKRKQLLANVAHEMRTPLTTINGMLEGLAYDVIPEDRKQRSIELMQHETSRLIRLVNENLDYENLRTQTIVLDKQCIRVESVVSFVVEQLRESAHEKNVEIKTEIPADLRVFADPDRFTQILVNIVRNAVQFTEDGLVTIQAYEEADYTVIKITDTGIGMTEEEIENIWERYYKADSSRTNTTFGESGLGMAIVRELLTLHQADCQIDSKPGQGSKFSLYFPNEKSDD